MTIEIELKFIATADAAANLADNLAQWPSEHSNGQKLSNTYFETADNQLRHWDMGLRIRGFGDSYEMTLKTAGQTVGGLHQRPEYNVALTEPVLDIQRLPAEVWPENTDLDALQQQLQPMFSTNFVREKWVVTYQNSEIEVALDQGDIVAGELSEPLHEIELELKKGQRDDLLAFAEELAKHDGLRLGSLSKAARGYALAKGNPPRELRPLPVLSVKPKTTVEQGMQSAFQLALSQWQYHEELWLRGNPEALGEIRIALETLRQTFSLYGSLVPRKASSALRQKLTALEEKLAEEQVDAAALCFSSFWLETQLMLTNWIVGMNWREFVDTKANAKLQGSFKRFSDIMLGRVSADLRETFSQVKHPNDYQDKLIRLKHALLSVHLLAGCYDAETVAAWIANWQQLQKGIQEKQEAWLDGYCRQAIKQPVFWKNSNA